LTIGCLPSLPSSTRSQQYEPAYPSRVPNIKNQATRVSDPLPSPIVVDSVYGSWTPAERGPQSHPTLQAYLAAEHERMLNRIRCANGPPSSMPVPAGVQPHVRFVSLVWVGNARYKRTRRTSFSGTKCSGMRSCSRNGACGVLLRVGHLTWRTLGTFASDCAHLLAPSSPQAHSRKYCSLIGSTPLQHSTACCSKVQRVHSMRAAAFWKRHQAPRKPPTTCTSRQRL
jgi:hypothetical protein